MMSNEQGQVVGPWSLMRDAILSVVIAGLTTTLGFNLAQLELLFRDFGAELPAFTQLVISYRPWIWLLVLVCVAGQVAGLITLMVKKSPAVRRHFQLVSVITAAFDGALIVAMYLPIFELGAVV